MQIYDFFRKVVLFFTKKLHSRLSFFVLTDNLTQISCKFSTNHKTIQAELAYNSDQTITH